MVQVNDLHIARYDVVSYDVLFGTDDRVCLRDTAEGAHRGNPMATSRRPVARRAGRLPRFFRCGTANSAS
jgi:hypothetical protein